MCYFPIEMETPFKLILLSPEEDKTGEANTAIQLFNLGLRIFHLRKPHWSIEQTQHFLEAIPKEFHNKIVLHSHFHLAGKFGIKGIHLSETNKKMIPELKTNNIITASFHSVQDIRENTIPYQYIFLSPIFESISKPGYHSKFDLNILAEELKDLKNKKTQLPDIIALGGITAENILKAREAGFAGAALLGTIWQSENPVETFQHIQSLVND